MAHTERDWEIAKAYFERGLSLSEIVARDDVVIKDRSGISKKAKLEGWAKGKIQPLVEKEVLARQALSEVAVEKSTQNSTERAVHETLVSELVKLQTFFRGANVLVANTVAAKVKEQGKNASFLELSQAAAALGRTQESVLGKGPDTVINNSNAVQTVVSLSPEVLRRINQELEDEC
jgi:hypothetical protein